MSFEGARRRSARHLRLHGLRPARSGARPFGKFKARQWRHVHQEGRQVALHNTAVARRAGIAFVPESRRSCFSIWSPSTRTSRSAILHRISRVLLQARAQRAIANGRSKTLQIRPSAVDLDLEHAVGRQPAEGRAREVAHLPAKVLMLCEPTRGMDVGAKNDVVKIVRSSAGRGPRPSSWSRPSRRPCCRSPTESS